MGFLKYTLIMILASAAFAGEGISIKYKTDAVITMKSKLKIESNQIIENDKCYYESVINYNMVNPNIPGKPFDIISEEIIRLDLGVIWDLNSGSKTYGEKEISSIFSLGSKKTDDIYSWSFDISPKKKKKKISGYKCQRYDGEIIGVNKGDPADSVLITVEYWSSIDTTIAAEISEFYSAYADGAGVISIWVRPQYATFMKEGYGDQIEKLFDLLGENSGFPMLIKVDIERTLIEGMTYEEYSGNSGRWKVFQMTDKVKSVKHEKTDDDIFEIPEDFTKR
jgi:hypothetical protein